MAAVGIETPAQRRPFNIQPDPEDLPPELRESAKRLRKSLLVDPLRSPGVKPLTTLPEPTDENEPGWNLDKLSLLLDACGKLPHDFFARLPEVPSYSEADLDSPEVLNAMMEWGSEATRTCIQLLDMWFDANGREADRAEFYRQMDHYITNSMLLSWPGVTGANVRRPEAHELPDMLRAALTTVMKPFEEAQSRNPYLAAECPSGAATLMYALSEQMVEQDADHEDAQAELLLNAVGNPSLEKLMSCVGASFQTLVMPVESRIINGGSAEEAFGLVGPRQPALTPETEGPRTRARSKSQGRPAHSSPAVAAAAAAATPELSARPSRGRSSTRLATAVPKDAYKESQYAIESSYGGAGWKSEDDRRQKAYEILNDVYILETTGGQRSEIRSKLAQLNTLLKRGQTQAELDVEIAKWKSDADRLRNEILEGEQQRRGEIEASLMDEALQELAPDDRVITNLAAMRLKDLSDLQTSKSTSGFEWSFWVCETVNFLLTAGAAAASLGAWYQLTTGSVFDSATKMGSEQVEKQVNSLKSLARLEQTLMKVLDKHGPAELIHIQGQLREAMAELPKIIDIETAAGRTALVAGIREKGQDLLDRLKQHNLSAITDMQSWAKELLTRDDPLDVKLGNTILSRAEFYTASGQQIEDLMARRNEANVLLLGQVIGGLGTARETFERMIAGVGQAYHNIIMEDVKLLTESLWDADQLRKNVLSSFETALHRFENDVAQRESAGRNLLHWFDSNGATGLSGLLQPFVDNCVPELNAMHLYNKAQTVSNSLRQVETLNLREDGAQTFLDSSVPRNLTVRIVAPLLLGGEAMREVSAPVSFPIRFLPTGAEESLPFSEALEKSLRYLKESPEFVSVPGARPDWSFGGEQLLTTDVSGLILSYTHMQANISAEYAERFGRNSVVASVASAASASSLATGAVPSLMGGLPMAPGTGVLGAVDRANVIFSSTLPLLTAFWHVLQGIISLTPLAVVQRSSFAESDPARLFIAEKSAVLEHVRDVGGNAAAVDRIIDLYTMWVYSHSRRALTAGYTAVEIARLRGTAHRSGEYANIGKGNLRRMFELESELIAREDVRLAQHPLARAMRVFSQNREMMRHSYLSDTVYWIGFITAAVATLEARHWMKRQEDWFPNGLSSVMMATLALPGFLVTRATIVGIYRCNGLVNSVYEVRNRVGASFASGLKGLRITAPLRSMLEMLGNENHLRGVLPWTVAMSRLLPASAGQTMGAVMLTAGLDTMASALGAVLHSATARTSLAVQGEAASRVLGEIGGKCTQYVTLALFLKLTIGSLVPDIFTSFLTSWLPEAVTQPVQYLGSLGLSFFGASATTSIVTFFIAVYLLRVVGIVTRGLIYGGSTLASLMKKREIVVLHYLNETSIAGQLGVPADNNAVQSLTNIACTGAMLNDHADTLEDTGHKLRKDDKLYQGYWVANIISLFFWGFYFRYIIGATS